SHRPGDRLPGPGVFENNSHCSGIASDDPETRRQASRWSDRGHLKSSFPGSQARYKDPGKGAVVSFPSFSGASEESCKLGRILQRSEVGIFRDAVQEKTGLLRALQVNESERCTPRPVLAARQERHGTGGIIKPLRCGNAEDPLHIRLGTWVVHPGSDQGTELKSIPELRVDRQRLLDLSQRGALILGPYEMRPSQVGPGTLRVQFEGSAEVSGGTGLIPAQPREPTCHDQCGIAGAGPDGLGKRGLRVGVTSYAGQRLSVRGQYRRGSNVQ